MKKQLQLLFLFCSLISLQLKAQNKVTYPTELTVAQDGSGNYQTIQEAVNSVRDLSQKQVVIHIRKGTYHEKLVIPSWKTRISLVGEDAQNTIIANADFSGKLYPGVKDAFGKDKFSTYTSYTVLVQGNDFTAENLTIQNTSGRVGQAVALHIEGDRCIIKNCRLLGNQDTLYAATERSRQFYQGCYIEGTTDFIFGEATAVFDKCIVKSLSNSYVSAAATSPRQLFGFVFLRCKFIADTSAKRVYLGRPWRPYAKTVVIHCELGNHILAAGWDPWKGDSMFPDKELTTYYAEYGNTGAGANTTGRVAWAKQLSSKEAKGYTINNILAGADNWNPADKP
ncbi:pectinesterase family protein [Mucilaginibacter agri]|uniref:Pectinesterase n=1 Tax=Mucilaginibacter agri TaxID=2695265 RepID=A0A966DTT3_9SPHI|nr:pectinesterase family protein [Mucilaginibacter agri]NCD70990.1 pectin esterase [Mucilaginibacter agri]